MKQGFGAQLKGIKLFWNMTGNCRLACIDMWRLKLDSQTKLQRALLRR
jgi:hypothetical protein